MNKLKYRVTPPKKKTEPINFSITSTKIKQNNSGQTGFFSLGEATSLEKENSEFKPVKLRLKIDLVSYPARGW